MRPFLRTALAMTVLAIGVPLVAFAQPAPAPTAQAAPASPSPTPEPVVPSAAPMATPTPVPSSAAPIVSPTPSSSPSASPYHFIVTGPSPAPGKPAIIEIDMLDQTLHAGASYSVRVKTSLDVTAINVSAMGATYGMQQAAPGLFASDGQVPGGIPFFLLNRDYTLTVTAQTADGRTVTLPVQLRLER